MAGDNLYVLLGNVEGEKFRFTFCDGNQMFAEVVSATHVDLDGTIVVCEAGKYCWQIQLSDIRNLAAIDGRLLYMQVERP